MGTPLGTLWEPRLLPRYHLVSTPTHSPPPDPHPTPILPPPPTHPKLGIRDGIRMGITFFGR